MRSFRLLGSLAGNEATRLVSPSAVKPTSSLCGEFMSPFKGLRYADKFVVSVSDENILNWSGKFDSLDENELSPHAMSSVYCGRDLSLNWDLEFFPLFVLRRVPTSRLLIAIARALSPL